MVEQDAVEQLALFTGQPRFAEMLHVGRPNIGNRDAFMRRVDDMLDRRWLTNDGVMVQELESRLTKFLGVRHCIAVCNATVGLELAIRALDLTGEVIVPSFTFIATAHALQWQQITPVFCDIDPATHSIDPRCAEELITERTTGIIGVHVWGRPAAVEALADLARRRNLKLLFDAAHAFAASSGGVMLGNFGNAEVFSFHATKFLNSFEGGAIATNDDALAEKLRLMKNFGFSGLDRVTSIGTNGKMTEVSAAMGLTSLESMQEFIDRNKRNYDRYRRNLNKLDGVSIVQYGDNERANYHYIVLEIDSDACGLTRDELIAVLLSENIAARRYFYPGCHRMEPYKTLSPDAGLRLPYTERLSERVLLLPNGTSISDADVDAISAIIRTALNNSAAVRTRLGIA